MKRAYVIGHPIGHSLSPHMHNAAFRALNIEAHYEAAEVQADDLETWVESARGPDLLGFNVTVPHKEAILPFLDATEGDARLAGAVNTVVVRHAVNDGGQPSSSSLPTRAEEGGQGISRLVGLNTDTLGFRRSLAEEAGLRLAGKRVVLLGAGGAARAVVVVALQDGVGSIVVANRHVERAERLLDAVQSLNHGTAARAAGLRSLELTETIKTANVVINATSVGLAADDEPPIDPDLISPGTLVVDLIYNPSDTVLLRAARARGARILGGLGMLVYQAGAAFESWTGVEPPVWVMRQAAEDALAARQAAR